MYGSQFFRAVRTERDNLALISIDLSAHSDNTRVKRPTAVGLFVRITDPDLRLELLASLPGESRKSGRDQQRCVRTRNCIINRLGAGIIIHRRCAGSHRIRLVELPGQCAAVVVFAAAVRLQCIAQPVGLHELGCTSQCFHIRQFSKRRVPHRPLDPPGTSMEPVWIVEVHRLLVFLEDRGIECP